MVNAADNAKQDELMEMCRTHATRWGNIDELRAFCGLSESESSDAVAVYAVKYVTLNVVHYARRYDDKWLGACLTVASRVGDDGELMVVLVNTYSGEVIGKWGNVRVTYPVEVAPTVLRELKMKWHHGLPR